MESYFISAIQAENLVFRKLSLHSLLILTALQYYAPITNYLFRLVDSFFPQLDLSNESSSENIPNVINLNVYSEFVDDKKVVNSVDDIEKLISHGYNKYRHVSSNFLLRNGIQPKQASEVMKDGDKITGSEVGAGSRNDSPIVNVGNKNDISTSAHSLQPSNLLIDALKKRKRRNKLENKKKLITTTSRVRTVHKVSSGSSSVLLNDDDFDELEEENDDVIANIIRKRKQVALNDENISTTEINNKQSKLTSDNSQDVNDIHTSQKEKNTHKPLDKKKQKKAKDNVKEKRKQTIFQQMNGFVLPTSSKSGNSQPTTVTSTITTADTSTETKTSMTTTNASTSNDQSSNIFINEQSISPTITSSSVDKETLNTDDFIPTTLFETSSTATPLPTSTNTILVNDTENPPEKSSSTSNNNLNDEHSQSKKLIEVAGVETSPPPSNSDSIISNSSNMTINISDNDLSIDLMEAYPNNSTASVSNTITTLKPSSFTTPPSITTTNNNILNSSITSNDSDSSHLFPSILSDKTQHLLQSTSEELKLESAEDILNRIASKVDQLNQQVKSISSKNNNGNKKKKKNNAGNSKNK